MAAEGGSKTLRRARRGSLTLASAPQLSSGKLPQTPKPPSTPTYSPEETWMWIKDVAEGFVLGKLVAENPDGSATAEVAGATRVVEPKARGPKVLDPATLSEPEADMVRMVAVDEPSILHNVKLRFAMDRIYTNIGTILVSANPFTVRVRRAVPPHPAAPRHPATPPPCTVY